MTPIRFGTDGWRAVIAEQFTFRAVETLTQAAADYWAAHPVPGRLRKVVVGFDGRFFSDRFARSVAEVFGANQFEVLLAPRPVPTPAVSFAVKNQKAVGGVMITASHNPPIFNGFKLKSHFGGSSNPETLQGVEAMLGRQPVRPSSSRSGTKPGHIRMPDLAKPYLAAVKRLVDFDLISRSGLRVAHDALFGVGAGCFEALLEGTSCRVTNLNATVDPLFGGLRPEPVAANYGPATAYLRKNPHDICLVTDGDADRIGGLDGKGSPFTTHQVICLLLHHLLANRKARGRVVKALNTTSMVDKICAAYDLPVTVTGVGFKFLCAEMAKGDVLVGVEESGGVGFPKHMPERDGLAAGMMLLELLARERKSPRALLRNLEREYGPHRYGRKDVRYPLERRGALLRRLQETPPRRLAGSSVAEVNTLDGAKFTANDGSWLMFRVSGTEPIVRIYAESDSDGRVRTLLRQGQQLLGPGRIH